MIKDLLWLVVMGALLCGGFTHVAAFLFGIFWVGFWGGFFRGVLDALGSGA